MKIYVVDLGETLNKKYFFSQNRTRFKIFSSRSDMS